MSEKEQGLTREELEAQEGEPLPAREVMSIVELDPNVISIPEDPTMPVDDDRHAI
jgi:hypothetical protein